MKCTVLVDNQADPSNRKLHREHGLSLLIETAQNRILFDSGASDLFVRNANELSIDLKTVDIVVLSHGHYDHGGGLAAFLSLNNTSKVYHGPGAFESHIAKMSILIAKDIGLNLKAIAPYKDRLISIEGNSEIASGVWLIPQIPLPYERPKDHEMFYKKPKTELERDDFAHEMLLVITEGDEIIVFTGCAHKGILNIVSAVEKQFAATEIKALFGGLHMTNPVTKRLAEKEEDIQGIGKKLFANAMIRQLYACHCTGETAFSILKKEMGNKLQPLMVGKQIVL
jgi:7,8-dihydropterin-6-yl-methyl-4-(beta-D-ribofuranosyl)aminobenzene 5'-phosphate synthase